MRDSKRVRTDALPSNAFQTELLHGSHPYGVMPVGAQMGHSAVPSVREQGLGFWAVLSNDQITDLLGLLDANSLVQIVQVSRAMYVLGHNPELWRALVIAKYPDGFCFWHSWKDTYASLENKQAQLAPHKPIAVKGFYSDEMFQAWMCATHQIDSAWIETDNVDHCKNLSRTDFIKLYEEANRPVVLDGAANSWPAVKKWKLKYLIEATNGKSFEAGPVKFTMGQYWDYAREAVEENTLYMFDPNFGENAPQLAEDYVVPSYFSEDLFGLLGKTRPNYRWIIIGASRSGSTFHVDPNATSAWNAVISGAKKWIMFPPETPPPGVIPSTDHSEVTSPVSLSEWFINFYPLLTATDGHIEFVAKKGDIVFIPSGWWHCVLNLEDSSDPGAPVVAITQNFVSSINIAKVGQFLKNKPEQVSGYCSDDGLPLYESFATKVRQFRPDIADKLINDAVCSHSKETLWNTMRTKKSDSVFSFGF